MPKEEKPVNEWTVLDTKFQMAAVLLPVVVNFTIMVLLGVPDPIIKNPATAMYWVPKLSTDFEFVSSHYSARQARDFVIS